MRGTAATEIGRLENFGARGMRAERKAPPSVTATMRALTDLGESVATSVHAIYTPTRLFLCVAMEPKPEALAAQAEADAAG